MQSRHHRRGRRLLGALFTATFLAVPAACSGGGGDPYGGAPASSDAAAETGPESRAPDAKGVTIATSETVQGTVLVDTDGHTLYLFTKDSPGKSTCVDKCLEEWPILEGKASAGGNVDAKLLGTTKRPDGKVQATYNGWPLYYYHEDSKPGDVRGQAVGGVWWVVDPKGEPVREPADGGGY